MFGTLWSAFQFTRSSVEWIMWLKDKTYAMYVMYQPNKKQGSLRDGETWYWIQEEEEKTPEENQTNQTPTQSQFPTENQTLSLTNAFPLLLDE